MHRQGSVGKVVRRTPGRGGILLEYVNCDAPFNLMIPATKPQSIDYRRLFVQHYNHQNGSFARSMTGLPSERKAREDLARSKAKISSV